ncbi:hypothetical protein [Terracidiphilus gabretensis]|uniref:hypothetical protein n=1 Tax=Terracidiphilus gabretensis TaxID=1577687 RepID=UPI00071B8C14|nr:hypothetical protein [Terracidiphilus gabretensis]
MKKSSFWISAAAALGLAVALAGCGTTTYFAGRSLPPSGLKFRVMVAIQNPSALSQGTLQVLDAYYDTRFKHTGQTVTFSISGYSGALPTTIQNMPEEQLGAVYGYGDGSFVYINYQKEATSGSQAGLPAKSAGVFVTRSQSYIFAATEASSQATVIDRTVSSAGAVYSLNLPGVYHVSTNAGGSLALYFVRNSNYAYYPIKLTPSQTLAYSGGTSTWPKAAVDCEPQNQPAWCLYQAQSPDHVDATGTPYGAPLSFDRPVKALFSNDGSTAYVLSCGPECGGTTSAVSLLPTGGFIFLPNQSSGQLPTNTALHTLCGSGANLTACSIAVPGGANNALIDSTTMYVIGQCLASTSVSSGAPACAGSGASSGLFTGQLTTLNLAPGSGATVATTSTASISDGAAGGPTRMIEADENTLWIAETKCTNGARFADGLAYGCLTMYNESTGAVTLLPYLGDATGIAAVTGLNKVYTAVGGQVHIYTTAAVPVELNNFYVSVTGTAYDVAYMDGLSDANNTVY